MPDEMICVYFVLSSERNEKGNFIPLIAVKGETGYHHTDWDWGDDYSKAVKFCKKKNLMLGISTEEAEAIVVSVLKEDDDYNSIEVRAAGYEWTCNRCGNLNNEIEFCSPVECSVCGAEFSADMPLDVFS